MDNMINGYALIEAFQVRREEDKSWHLGEGGMTYTEIINFIIDFMKEH